VGLGAESEESVLETMGGSRLVSNFVPEELIGKLFVIDHSYWKLPLGTFCALQVQYSKP
jgi:hypothetical protein